MKPLSLLFIAVTVFTSLNVFAQNNMFQSAFWKKSCSPFKNQPVVNVTSDNGSATVNDIVTDGTVTYIAGQFTHVKGVARHNLAAIDNAGNVLPFNPRVSNSVNDIVLSGSTL